MITPTFLTSECSFLYKMAVIKKKLINKAKLISSFKIISFEELRNIKKTHT